MQDRVRAQAFHALGSMKLDVIGIIDDRLQAQPMQQVAAEELSEVLPLAVVGRHLVDVDGGQSLRQLVEVEPVEVEAVETRQRLKLLARVGQGMAEQVYARDDFAERL